MFLSQFWGLETSPRTIHFYDFNEIGNITRSVNFWWLIFTNFNSPLFTLSKKIGHWELNIIGTLVIGAGLLIENSLPLGPSPLNRSKDFRKLLPLFTFIK